MSRADTARPVVLRPTDPPVAMIWPGGAVSRITRIAVIDRRYCLRLALGENDPNDREDRDALSMFGASLPPPRSRLLIVLRLFAVIAVSQVLLALLLRSQEDVARSRGKATAEHVIAQLATVAELNPGTFHRDRQRAAAQQSDGALNLWVKGTLAHATPA